LPGNLANRGKKKKVFLALTFKKLAQNRGKRREKKKEEMRFYQN